MENKKHMKSFNEHQENLNISDVISRFLEQKSFSYNIPINKLYINFDKGKMFIYKFNKNDYMEMLEYVDINDI